MLGGLEPVIIIQLSTLSNALPINQQGPVQQNLISKIPLVSQIPTLIDQPPIPIYLSDKITGIFIDSESKGISVNTDSEAKTDGTPVDVNQQAIANTVSINLKARKDSLALLLLSSLLDLCYDKLASKEYAITYLHDSITVFRGVLHDFTIEQSADTELATIKIELSKGTKSPQKPNGVVTLSGQVGSLPGG